MKSLLKALLPLRARTAIKRAGYGLLDIVQPIRDPRIPPRRDTFIGGGGFEIVGISFLETLRRHGLRSDMEILDVGCGQGRMARPLVGQIPDGHYIGFDIDKSGIDWCQSRYADAPNFTFLHADIMNARYNKHGLVTAANYVFPFPDERFDIVFLTSVFTHMFKADVENYLAEIARVLKPGGTALITWFLWDDRDKPAPVMDFHADIDAVSRTTLPENPEAAIAFQRDYVERLYAKTGLEISTIELGGWREGVFDGLVQDLVVARKG